MDSQGVLVASTAPPTNDYWEYLDANDPGYAAFKASQGARPGRIYVGANDGMMHAFEETTGNEVWAFIPRDFYRTAPPTSNDKAGLIGLTYQPGGLPIYDHRFYVNATPRVVDANIGGTTGRRCSSAGSARAARATSRSTPPIRKRSSTKPRPPGSSSGSSAIRISATRTAARRS